MVNATPQEKMRAAASEVAKFSSRLQSLWWSIASKHPSLASKEFSQRFPLYYDKVSALVTSPFTAGHASLVGLINEINALLAFKGEVPEEHRAEVVTILEELRRQLLTWHHQIGMINGVVPPTPPEEPTLQKFLKGAAGVGRKKPPTKDYGELSTLLDGTLATKLQVPPLDFDSETPRSGQISWLLTKLEQLTCELAQRVAPIVNLKPTRSQERAHVARKQWLHLRRALRQYRLADGQLDVSLETQTAALLKRVAEAQEVPHLRQQISELEEQLSADMRSQDRLKARHGAWKQLAKRRKEALREACTRAGTAESSLEEVRSKLTAITEEGERLEKEAKSHAVVLKQRDDQIEVLERESRTVLEARQRITDLVKSPNPSIDQIRRCVAVWPREQILEVDRVLALVRMVEKLEESIRDRRGNHPIFLELTALSEATFGRPRWVERSDPIQQSLDEARIDFVADRLLTGVASRLNLDLIRPAPGSSYDPLRQEPIMGWRVPAPMGVTPGTVAMCYQVGFSDSQQVHLKARVALYGKAEETELSAEANIESPVPVAPTETAPPEGNAPPAAGTKKLVLDF